MHYNIQRKLYIEKSIEYDSFPTSWKCPSLTTRIAARLPYDYLNTIMMPLVDLKFIDNKRVTKGNINIFLCNSVCFCFICFITSMQHYLKIFSIHCNVECLRLILGFNGQSVEMHMWINLLGGKNKTIGVSNHIHV